jgi:hypothetical protein
MLLCSDVYNALVDILRADGRGLAISPDEFTRIARLVNQQLYDKFYAEFEKNTANIDVLAGFKTIGASVALVAGVGSLPSDYRELIGKPLTNTGKYVDLVSSLELAEREDDYLTQPTTDYPCAILGDTDGSGDIQIRVFPVDATITSVTVDYLRETSTPYLDWYVNNTTQVVTFMAADTAVSVPSGSTYRDGTAGGGAAINSLTENFEWGDAEFPLIISMFCTHLGVAYPDTMLYQAGQVGEQKN